MNERQREARDHGDYEVFLSAQEIGLMVGALTWVKITMAAADNWLHSLPDDWDNIRDSFSDDAFTILNPAIDATRDRLLGNAMSDCDERSDPQGRTRLQEAVEEVRDQLAQIHEMSMAALRASGAAGLADALPDEDDPDDS